MILLDTNIVSYIIKNMPPYSENLLERLKFFNPKEVYFSALTEYEIYAGIAGIRKNTKEITVYVERLTVAADHLFKRHSILDIQSPNDTKRAAQIIGHMKNIGQPMGSIDALIAAQAARYQYILVSNDGDFIKLQKHMPELMLHVESWSK